MSCNCGSWLSTVCKFATLCLCWAWGHLGQQSKSEDKCEAGARQDKVEPQRQTGTHNSLSMPPNFQPQRCAWPAGTLHSNSAHEPGPGFRELRRSSSGKWTELWAWGCPKPGWAMRLVSVNVLQPHLPWNTSLPHSRLLHTFLWVQP